MYKSDACFKKNVRKAINQVSTQAQEKVITDISLWTGQSTVDDDVMTVCF